MDLVKLTKALSKNLKPTDIVMKNSEAAQIAVNYKNEYIEEANNNDFYFEDISMAKDYFVFFVTKPGAIGKTGAEMKVNANQTPLGKLVVKAIITAKENSTDIGWKIIKYQVTSDGFASVINFSFLIKWKDGNEAKTDAVNLTFSFDEEMIEEKIKEVYGNDFTKIIR